MLLKTLEILGFQRRAIWTKNHFGAPNDGGISLGQAAVQRSNTRHQNIEAYKQRVLCTSFPSR